MSPTLVNPQNWKKTKVGLYWFKSYGEFIEIQNEIHLCEREEPALVSFSPQGWLDFVS
jgi:hypothetical protein